MAELDRLPRIKATYEAGNYVDRVDIGWLITQLDTTRLLLDAVRADYREAEPLRAEIGRLLSLLDHHNISPNDPGGRYTYGVVIANPPPDTP